MIWGMTLEPGKLYTEIMGEEVQLSLAAIDSRKEVAEGPNGFCQIIMKTSKSEYVLCTLVHGVMFQQSLDLKLMPREKVTFSVQGPNVVYLVGYTASYPEDVEIEMEEELVETTGNSSSWEQYGEEDEQYMVLKRPEEDLRPKMTEPIGEISDGMQLEDSSVNAQPVPVVKPERLPHPDQADMDGLPQTGTSQGPAVKVEVLPQEQAEFYSNQSGASHLPKTMTDEEYPTEEFYYPEGQIPATTPEVYQSTPIAGIEHHEATPGEDDILPIAEPFAPPENPTATPAFNPRLQVGTSTSTIMAPLRSQPSPRRQARGGRSRVGRKPKNTGHLQTLPGPGQGRLATGPSTSSDVIFPSQHSHQQQQLVHHNPRITATEQDSNNSWSGPQNNRTHPVSRGTPALARARTKWKQRDADNGAGGDKRRVGLLCNFCNRGFSTLGSLKMHERVHTGERPFVCRHCPKSFTQKGSLHRHERIHTGVKPYLCVVCQKRFSQRSNLNSHMRTHSKH